MQAFFGLTEIREEGGWIDSLSNLQGIFMGVKLLNELDQICKLKGEQDLSMKSKDSECMATRMRFRTDEYNRGTIMYVKEFSF
jgi:hypothetical protein